MLFLPKFSQGASVIIEGIEEEGKIESLEALLKVSPSGRVTYKVVYMVKVLGDVRRIPENNLKDVKEVSSDITNDMDQFLADTLLMSRKDAPEAVERTIKELLNNDSSGGKADEQTNNQYEGLL